MMEDTGENNIKPKQEAGEAMSIKVKDQNGGEVRGSSSQHTRTDLPAAPLTN